jgi:hypothetical protein
VEGKTMIEMFNTFAYYAIPIEDKKKYNVSYLFLVNDPQKQKKIEDGARFSQLAESVTLNTVIHDLDMITAIYYPDTFIQEYQPNNAYKRGTVCFYLGNMVVLTQDVLPNGMTQDKYKRFIDMRGLSFTATNPYFSPKTLYTFLNDGDNTYFVPTAVSSPLTNGNKISQNMDKMVKDYLDNSDVIAHQNDDFHIQVYSETFLVDETSAPDAFHFNFQKKLIFCNTTNDTITIKKNFGECFPANCFIYFWYKNRIFRYSTQQLREIFSEKRMQIQFSDHISVAQISGSEYLITDFESLLYGYQAIIDFSNKKLYRRIGNAVIQDGKQGNGVIATKDEDEDYVCYDFKDTSSIQPLMTLELQTQRITLQIEECTYYFIVKSETLCDIIKFDSYAIEFSFHQKDVPIPEGFNCYKQQYKIIQINKNYGQFDRFAPMNKHLWFVKNFENWKFPGPDQYFISPSISAMGWISVDDSMNFTIEQILLNSNIEKLTGNIVFLENDKVNMLYPRNTSTYNLRSANSYVYNTVNLHFNVNKFNLKTKQLIEDYRAYGNMQINYVGKNVTSSAVTNEITREPKFNYIIPTCIEVGVPNSKKEFPIIYSSEYGFKIFTYFVNGSYTFTNYARDDKQNWNSLIWYKTFTKDASDVFVVKGEDMKFNTPMEYSCNLSDLLIYKVSYTLENSIENPKMNFVKTYSFQGKTKEIPLSNNCAICFA